MYTLYITLQSFTSYVKISAFDPFSVYIVLSCTIKVSMSHVTTYLCVKMFVLLVRQLCRDARQAEVVRRRWRPLRPGFHEPQRGQAPVLVPPWQCREVLEVRAVRVLNPKQKIYYLTTIYGTLPSILLYSLGTLNAINTFELSRAVSVIIHAWNE